MNVSLQPAPKLGQILLKHTSLSEEQLDEALRIQDKEGGLLGDILIRRNMILPHEIMRALCIQLGIPFIEDLKPTEIDPKLVSGIPINYSKAKEALPIAKETSITGETLIVCVSDPFNESIMDDLQVLTGMPVRICVSTSMRIQDAINRVYERNTDNMVGEIEGEFEEAMDLEGPIDLFPSCQR